MNIEKIVRSIYELMLRGETAAAFELVHPGFVVREADGLPYGGTYEGYEGFQRLLGAVFQTWKGAEISVEEVVGHGERVFALLTLRGRVGPADELVATEVVEVWTVRDGKAVDLRPFYWDTARIARAAAG
jgi:ketosteroid isomerase-like protein